MSSQLVHSHEVANLLNTWYTLMRANDLEGSNEIKGKIDQRIHNMEEDQTMLIYYSLLDFRHKLLFKQFDTAKKVLNKVEPFKEDMNDLLTYYYYFFSGMYAYSNKQYESALDHYKSAEKKLDCIEDELERAEFHYKVGSVYYQIKQTLISLDHTKKAFEIYKENIGYMKKAVHCDILLAANYVDLRRFKEAESHYKNAKKDAIKLGDKPLQTLINYNIGLFYSEQGCSEEAIRFLNFVLEDQLFNQNYYVKAHFTLTREYFKIEEEELAIVSLNQGLDYAKKINNKEYLVKLNFLRALYTEGNDFELVFEEGFSYFNVEMLYLDIEEYAEMCAQFYCRHKAFEKAVHYFQLAIQARQKMVEMEALK